MSCLVLICVMLCSSVSCLVLMCAVSCSSVSCLVALCVVSCSSLLSYVSCLVVPHYPARRLSRGVQLPGFSHQPGGASPGRLHQLDQ